VSFNLFRGELFNPIPKIVRRQGASFISCTAVPDLPGISASRPLEVATSHGLQEAVRPSGTRRSNYIHFRHKQSAAPERRNPDTVFHSDREPPSPDEMLSHGREIHRWTAHGVEPPTRIKLLGPHETATESRHHSKRKSASMGTAAHDGGFRPNTHCRFH